MKAPQPLIPLFLRRMYLHNTTERLDGVKIDTKAIEYGEHEAAERHVPGLKVLQALDLCSDTYDSVTRFWLPEGYEPPSLRDVLSHMDTGKSPAITELITYLLLKGKGHYTYGRDTWLPVYVHTLLCGIDWEKVADPESETWSEFAGSFVDNEESPMTSVRLHCLCGYVGEEWSEERCRIGVEELSVGELIRVISGEMHDQL